MEDMNAGQSVREVISQVNDLRELYEMDDDLTSLDKLASLLSETDSTINTVVNDERARIEDNKRELTKIQKRINELTNPKSNKQMNETHLKNELSQLEESIITISKEIDLIHLNLTRMNLKVSDETKKIEQVDNELKKIKIRFEDKQRSKSKKLTENDVEKLNLNDRKEQIMLIKIRLFEQIGLKIDHDLNKLLILNKSNNSMNSFDLKGDNQYSDYFMANFIWDNI